MVVWKVAMFIVARVALLGTLLAFLSGCSGAVDAVLTERHFITKGTLNGFQIGEDKAHVLEQTKSLGVYAITAHQTDIYQFQLFKLKDISSEESTALAKLDYWSFEKVEKPAGAFYKLHFVDGRLASISYERPRLGIK